MQRWRQLVSGRSDAASQVGVQLVRSLLPLRVSKYQRLGARKPLSKPQGRRALVVQEAEVSVPVPRQAAPGQAVCCLTVLL